jgi:hypothetical protein
MYYLANPIKDMNSETFLGVGHPLMASIFSGSTDIPSYEIMYPK